ncbi:hypothetical protein CR194_15735 [Salipaludibacillus keqinensis]|uniref:Uncharacterized protein n=1 Tax=Salipaludibacillus keqinensis TaxID=2045207 RepID=A0A323TF23_9BACI|nr:hypothetical protein CR194_15735 [Salipaludibacillus keqinensis]
MGGDRIRLFSILVFGDQYIVFPLCSSPTSLPASSLQKSTTKKAPKVCNQNANLWSKYLRLPIANLD